MKHRLYKLLIILLSIIEYVIAFVTFFTAIVPLICWIVTGDWDWLYEKMSDFTNMLHKKNDDAHLKIEHKFKVTKNRFVGHEPIITAAQKNNDNYITNIDLHKTKERKDND